MHGRHAVFTYKHSTNTVHNFAPPPDWRGMGWWFWVWKVEGRGILLILRRIKRFRHWIIAPKLPLKLEGPSLLLKSLAPSVIGELVSSILRCESKNSNISEHLHNTNTCSDQKPLGWNYIDKSPFSEIFKNLTFWGIHQVNLFIKWCHLKSVTFARPLHPELRHLKFVTFAWPLPPELSHFNYIAPLLPYVKTRIEMWPLLSIFRGFLGIN